MTLAHSDKWASSVDQEFSQLANKSFFFYNSSGLCLCIALFNQHLPMSVSSELIEGFMQEKIEANATL